MNEAESRLRLFTAIELPDDWRAALGRVSSQLQRVGGDEFKWVRNELLHVTLVFLGNQDAAALPSVIESLQSAAQAGAHFNLSLSHLGRFGPPHALTVLWAGLDGPSPELVTLHGLVSERLRAAHIAFDPKPLVPHVTLARGRRPINREASMRMASAIQSVDVPHLSATIDHFVLMQSRLSPRGPSYEVVRSLPLWHPDA